MRHTTDQKQDYVAPEISRYHAAKLYKTLEGYFSHANLVTAVSHLNFVFDHYLENAEGLTDTDTIVIYRGEEPFQITTMVWTERGREFVRQVIKQILASGLFTSSKNVNHAVVNPRR